MLDVGMKSSIFSKVSERELGARPTCTVFVAETLAVGVL